MSFGYQVLGFGSGGGPGGKDVHFMCLGGGGVGGIMGGGGGAGGLRTSYGSDSGGGCAAESQAKFVAGVQYVVTVGAGGTGKSDRTVTPDQGEDSSIIGASGASITSLGGGYGSCHDSSATWQTAGGCGGGSSAGHAPEAGGLGTACQGYAGGDGGEYLRGVGYPGSGGGGTGAAGTAAVNNTVPATAGGVGTVVDIDGNSYYWGGGGGGSTYNTGSNGGAGGLGGGGGGSPMSGGSGGGGGGSAINGGTGGSPGSAGGNGGTNSGGGGGSGKWLDGPEGSGGSGYVVLRIPDVDYSGITTGSPTVDTSTDPSNTILKYSGTGSYTAA